MHLNSKLLFQKYARPYFRPGMKVLEIGPDEVPSSFRQLVDVPEIEWHTIDMYESDQLTFRNVDEYTFPIDSEQYDLVLSAQVIEHVRKIWQWMPEVARVCRTGGTIVTINPVSFRYHEAPVDCWRIYPEGMRALYDAAGIDTVMSVSESHEPFSTRARNTWRLLRKVLMHGKIPSTGLPPTVDTISIGSKRAAQQIAA